MKRYANMQGVSIIFEADLPEKHIADKLARYTKQGPWVYIETYEKEDEP